MYVENICMSFVSDSIRYRTGKGCHVLDTFSIDETRFFVRTALDPHVHVTSFCSGKFDETGVLGRIAPDLHVYHLLLYRLWVPSVLPSIDEDFRELKF